MTSNNQQPNGSIELKEEKLEEENHSYELDTSLVIDEALMKILHEDAEQEENERFYREVLALQQEAHEEEEGDQQAPDDISYDMEEFENMEWFLLTQFPPAA